jgi:NAD dependent epimerase/dehydratase family enzyme
MAKILITGGTGLVGQQLIHELLAGGHEIHVLSRNGNTTLSGIKQFYWNVHRAEIDLKAFEQITHIVHLAGAGIADARWSDARKKEIQDSRVQSTQLLMKGIKESGIKPEMFVGASAIGYYGAITIDKIFEESDAPANDFMGETCRLWEQ